jgi:hypothetical protein
MARDLLVDGFTTIILSGFPRLFYLFWGFGTGSIDKIIKKEYSG